MNVLLAVMRRDFRRTIRSPLTTVLLLVLPLGMATLISLAFGSGPPQLRLLLSYDDESTLGDLVGGAIDRLPDERFQITRVDSADGMRRLEEGEASAFLHVPAGFLADVADGRQATLTLRKSSREQIMPQVAEEGALILADGLSAAALVFGEPIRDIRGLATDDKSPGDADVASVSTLINRIMTRSGRYLVPPAVGFEKDESGDDAGGSPGRIFLFVIPGLTVMALLYIADQTMRDLVGEMGSGTLGLALTAPIGPAHLVAGKVLFTVVLGLASLAVVIPFALPFVESPVSLPAFLALSVAFCLAAGGFAAITYGLARNERQGGVVGNVVMLAMAFLGGSYIPLEALPPAMRALSPFTLNFWAVDGYAKVIRDGEGLAGVAPDLALLLALAALFLLGGGGLLRARIGRSLR